MAERLQNVSTGKGHTSLHHLFDSNDSSIYIGNFSLKTPELPVTLQEVCKYIQPLCRRSWFRNYRSLSTNVEQADVCVSNQVKHEYRGLQFQPVMAAVTVTHSSHKHRDGS